MRARGGLREKRGVGLPRAAARTATGWTGAFAEVRGGERRGEQYVRVKAEKGEAGFRKGEKGFCYRGWWCGRRRRF